MIVRLGCTFSASSFSDLVGNKTMIDGQALKATELYKNGRRRVLSAFGREGPFWMSHAAQNAEHLEKSTTIGGSSYRRISSELHAWGITGVNNTSAKCLAGYQTQISALSVLWSMN
jgi:hypothetical protein